MGLDPELFLIIDQLYCLSQALMTECRTTLRTQSAPESDTFAQSLIDGRNISRHLNEMNRLHVEMTGYTFMYEFDPNWDQYAIKKGLHTQAEFKAQFGIDDVAWQQVIARI